MPVIGGVSTGSVTEEVAVTAGNLTADGALTIADVDAGESSFTPQAATAGSNGYGTFTLAPTAAGPTPPTTARRRSRSSAPARRSPTASPPSPCDGTASQLVTVTIHGTNDVPVIGGVSTGSVTEEVAVTAGNLTADGALTIADVDAGQSSFTPQAATAGSNGYGTFTLGADGSWTYTADNSQTAIQELGAGTALTDSFTAVSSDGTASQLVTVTIHGTNDVPVIGGVSTGSGRPRMSRSTAGNLTAGGALTIADVDPARPASRPRPPPPAANGYGTFTLGADGSWTYTADNSQSGDPGARRRRQRSPTASPPSPCDGTASQLVTVTIHGTNDVPVIGGCQHRQRHTRRSRSAPATSPPTAP